jgi:hypothetical protein
MIEGQEVMKRTYSSKLLSVEGHLTKTVSAQTCLGVFFIRSVSDTIFAVLFLPKPSRIIWRSDADHRRPSDHSLSRFDSGEETDFHQLTFAVRHERFGERYTLKHADLSALIRELTRVCEWFKSIIRIASCTFTSGYKSSVIYVS